MRSIQIDDKALAKLSRLPSSLMKSDFKESLKSYFPGEWIFFRDPVRRKVYLGFVNPLVGDKFPSVHILCQLDKMPTVDVVKEYLENKITRAVKYRALYKGYETSSRLVYGDSDGLPGLVVDLYENGCFVQLNSAGMDKQRELIRETLTGLVKTPVFIVDGAKKRTQELLPVYREEINLDVIKIKENGFNYNISIEKIQKNGWYFDHRENRKRLEEIIKSLNVRFKNGLDLFCYQGAWGFHLKRAGCDSVHLVDQADMEHNITSNADLNGLIGISFERKDVFDWLNSAIKSSAKYDLIVSDPPAFAKSRTEKKSAIDGYVKLHKKIMKIASSHSLVCFASCTQYVDETEFLETIELAAKSEKRNIRILDRGQQSWDHPIDQTSSKSNYIKSIIVYME